MGLLRSAALLLTTLSPLTISPHQGAFSGDSSQGGKGIGTAFQVTGSTVQNQIVGWRAHCQSGRNLVDSTGLPSASLRGDSWSTPPGSYAEQLPYVAYPAPGHRKVTAHFRVLQAGGQFTSPISALGVWRLTAVLDSGGRKVDSCSTGTVHWIAGTFASGAPSPVVVPAGSTVGGLTGAQWMARAWQWELANDRELPSAAPSTAPCITRGQHGPVWFLDALDHSQGNTLTINCAVPAGDYVTLVYPSSECSTVEKAPYHATTGPGLLRCASRTYGATRAALAIDGQVAAPSGGVVTTAPFRFRMPARDNLLQVPGVTSGLAAAHGPSLIVGPLTPGHHSLVRVYQYSGGYVNELAWNLTVS